MVKASVTTVGDNDVVVWGDGDVSIVRLSDRDIVTIRGDDRLAVAEALAPKLFAAARAVATACGPDPFSTAIDDLREALG